MDVLFGLRNPDLTNFVLLLKVYDQLVLSLNDIPVFFDGTARVIKPLFEVLNFLSLNLVQNF